MNLKEQVAKLQGEYNHSDFEAIKIVLKKEQNQILTYLLLKDVDKTERLINFGW